MTNDNFNLISFVLLFPVVGFLIQAFLGQAVIKALGSANGKRVMGILAVLPVFMGFVIGVMITQQLATLPADSRSHVVTLFQWIDIAGLKVPFELLVDPLSMTMVLIITGIGALIHLYATGYMGEEKDYARFFTYMNLFIASMLILVLGNNLVIMFIGWEGVGLCSYLLIGFWYKDVANAKAANKAFIVNRIGDWGLTLGMFMLTVVLAGSSIKSGGGRFLSYDVILPNVVHILTVHPVLATTIALLFFVGACGKSAQFPLYLWLPDAMAGPTPVSALIHAATMVTAGVFMLNRLHTLFELSPVASAIIACVGAFTALFAALVAFGQTDIKKVLAYSTVSQLGFMFIACGAGAYWVGMFHVTTHAFFKALLFLGAGAVIHGMSHNQDMRNYGKLMKYLPITAITMIVGYFAISGVPFLSGFYSKEAILGAALAGEHAEISGIRLGYYAGWVGLFVAMLTAFYMTRMTFLTFFGNEERWRLVPDQGHGHHEEHAAHTPHEHTDHGPDVHDFYFTGEELDAKDFQEEQHHELDKKHLPHEAPISMWFPLVVLAVLSAVGGYFLDKGDLFQKWLYPSGLPVLGEVPVHPETGIEKNLMWLSIAAATLGIILGLIVYLRGLPKKEGWDEKKWSKFRLSARDQFGYDNLMVNASVEGGNDLGVALWKGADVGVIDGIVNGSAFTAGWLGKLGRFFQTGFLRMYALIMLAGAVGILGWIGYAIFKMGGSK